MVKFIRSTRAWIKVALSPALVSLILFRDQSPLGEKLQLWLLSPGLALAAAREKPENATNRALIAGSLAYWSTLVLTIGILLR